MIFKLNPKNYKTLFRLDRLKGRVTCLLSDFIMRGSLAPVNPIITYNGRWWTFRIRKSEEENLARRGLAFFKDKMRYEKYAREFKRYIKFAQKNIAQKYKKIPKKITKKEFICTSIEMKKFWHYYGFTEMVYHEMAYRELAKKKNKTLEKNIRKLEKLKFEGRDLLNSYLLEKGTIDNILKCIAKNNSIKAKDVRYLYTEELNNLLEGAKISQKTVENRKSSFVVIGLGKNVKYLEGKEAKKITDDFDRWEAAEFAKAKKGFKGISANKGKVQGKVVISPMLDVKMALKIGKRMNKGDILVVQSTNPDLISLCKKAGAIVTDQGGMLSHAAIISRELKIPCIVGTVNATKILKTGDLVEVDANKGVVKILKRKK
jgi:phosphoenolpyruvate synthase/pyruvate phosphate dikinase